MVVFKQIRNIHQNIYLVVTAYYDGTIATSNEHTYSSNGTHKF